ncbi:MAG: hypothetical protein ACOZE5_03180 [Verrucomicrobiota bacterium]
MPTPDPKSGIRDSHARGSGGDSLRQPKRNRAIERPSRIGFGRGGSENQPARLPAAAMGWRWTDLHKKQPRIVRATAQVPDRQDWDATALDIGRSVCEACSPCHESRKPVGPSKWRRADNPLRTIG